MRFERFKRTLALFKEAATGWLRDDAFGAGAALAFYTVFSIGPLLVISTAIAALVIGEKEVQAQLVRWADSYLGREGAEAALNMIPGPMSVRSGLVATGVGIVTLFFGATGVFGRLKRSLNAMWGVRPETRPIVHRLLIDRLAAAAAAAGIGVVLFLGLLLSAGIAAAGSFVGRWVPLPAAVLFFVNLLFSLVIVTPLFALIFKFLPNAKVPWRSVWIGAVLTAVLFQAGALAMGAYLGTRVLASVYGPAGSVLAVLVWAYYSAQAVLFGAQFTKAHARAADDGGRAARGSCCAAARAASRAARSAGPSSSPSPNRSLSSGRARSTGSWCVTTSCRSTSTRRPSTASSSPVRRT
ncbi:MAG: YihY/virulence factor BrkB family protein [Planctomycetota bacterium]|jgi:membrane protein